MNAHDSVAHATLRARWDWLRATEILVSCLACAALVYTLLGISWRKLFLFWLDEAMLLLSLREMHTASALFKPLTLYDQTSPIGFSFISFVIFRLSDSVTLHKLLPLGASLLVVAMIAFTAWKGHRSYLMVATAVFLTITNSEFAFLFGDFKHYIFEILTFAIFLLAVEYREQRRPLIIVAAAISLLFTNVTPMLIVALAVMWLEGDRRFLFAVIATLSLLFCVSYVVLVRPSASLQLENFRHIYESGFVSTPTAFARKVHQIIISNLPDVVDRVKPTILAYVLFLIGLGAALRKRQAHAVGFVAILCFTGVLSYLKLYPLLRGRYSSYLLPFLVMFAVSGTSIVLGQVKRLVALAVGEHVVAYERVGRMVTVCALAILGLASLARNSELYFHLGEMPFDHVVVAASDPSRAIVPLFIVQPQVELARLVTRVSGGRYIEVNPYSGLAVTPEQAEATLDRSFGSPGIWSFLLKAEQSARGWTPTKISLQSYFDWVTRTTRNERQIVLITPRCFPHLNAQIGAFVTELSRGAAASSLKKTACFETLLITRPPHTGPRAEAEPN